MKNEEQIKKIEEIFDSMDWSKLWEDEPESGFAKLIPYASIILQVIILFLLWQK